MSDRLGVPYSAPTRYVSPYADIIPIKRFPRRPLTTDKKYPTGQVVLLGKSPSTGSQGELWYLAYFDSNGDAIWKHITDLNVVTTQYDADTGSATPASNILNLTGGTGVDTSASGNTVTFTVDLTELGTVATTYTADTGSATPAANNLNILGGSGIQTSGSGSTLTISLSGGGLAIDQIAVDASSGGGTNPVVPSATGEITVTGAQVAAGTVGANVIRTDSLAANTYTIEIQRSTTSATSASLNNGISHFLTHDFSVDSNGLVSTKPLSNISGVKNLGTNYDAGTGIFSITAADGSALSATNPGYILIPSKVTSGEFVTIAITANQDFIDDVGASEIIGNLFGLTTGISTGAVYIPFFIYAVINDTDTAVAFMISRFPRTSLSPMAANIGMPSSAAADTQSSFFSFENITAADYENNPCMPIGSLTMTMSAADDWTVSTSVAHGIGGSFYSGVQFSFPRGQFGSASSKVFTDNGGTAPDDADGDYRYYIDWENNRFNAYVDFPSIDTAGLGAVNAQMSTPYKLGITGPSGSGILNSGGTYSTTVPSGSISNQYVNIIYANSGASGILINTDLGAGVDYKMNVIQQIEYSP